MDILITKKITSVALASPPTPEKQEEKKSVPQRTRPKVLSGKTWRIKPPPSEHAYFLTVNVDPDTQHPIEVFLNTKDSKAQVWIGALTLCLSAILREANNGQAKILPVLENFADLTDPAMGGYFGESPEGKNIYFSSILAEISAYLVAECGKFSSPQKEKNSSFPSCPKCDGKMNISEGCATCTSCGYSKCG